MVRMRRPQDEPILAALPSSSGNDDPSQWLDVAFSAPEPPPDWTDELASFADSITPPQLVRIVNLLPLPGHALAIDDPEGIADFVLARAREGVADVFAHEDYGLFTNDDLYENTEGLETEDWARAVAEHQTGIPYTQPAYFYGGGQKAVATAIRDAGRYPLAGQCQQSATTALCLGGWDGGPYGDIGSGIGSQPFCAKLGEGWTPDELKAQSAPGKTGLVLADWSDALWNAIRPGTCLFWSAPCPFTKDGETCGGGKHVVGCGMGSGHVAVVLRKHPSERKWQLWDTTTSFSDPTTHPAAVKGARMLWESHWWGYIPQIMQGGAWHFRGLGHIEGIGRTVVENPRPRGRCRLILRRRKDGALLHRTPWLSMEEENLPISWLLRSMRGVPHFDTIDATWCVDSPGDGPQKPPLPLLDLGCDAKGNAQMRWTPVQGSHKRPLSPALWKDT